MTKPVVCPASAPPPARAPNLTFAHAGPGSDCELRVQKGHYDHGTTIIFRCSSPFPKLAWEHAARLAGAPGLAAERPPRVWPGGDPPGCANERAAMECPKGHSGQLSATDR